MRAGALLARCYFDATENNCAINQLKPGLKSMAQYFYFKGALETMHLHYAYYTHRDKQKHILNIKNERITM